MDFACQDKTPQLCKQARLVVEQSTIAIVGVGALGTVAAQHLVRAGAKHIILIDDDKIESSNLPRQVLFDQEDIGRYKVEIAKTKLKLIVPDLKLIDYKQRLTQTNANTLLSSAQIVLDCTDSIDSRLLINDWCKEKNIPWVHAAAIGITGEVMIITDKTIDYKKLINNKKIDEKCSDLGILGVTSSITASLQVSFALRLLIGKTKDLENVLVRINAWDGTIDKFNLS